MAKKEIKDQLESFESYINDIPLIIDPCRICKRKDRTKKPFNRNYNIEICKRCSWWYPSEFKLDTEAKQ